MRLILLMRSTTLEWTLSRRQTVNLRAPPQIWEQYSKRRRDFHIDKSEKMREAQELWRGNSFCGGCLAN